METTSDKPGWWSTLVVEEQEPEDKGQTVTKGHVGQPATVRYFTPQDAATLKVVQMSTTNGKTTISNSQVGAALGVTRAAASTRIKRLVEMGILIADYEVAQITGEANKRTLTIVQVPPTPWEPE